MYWEQTAAMRADTHLIKIMIKRGVRQGCVFFPDIFSLYSEMIMRNLDGYPEIKVGGHSVKLETRHVNDTVLVAENKEDLQQS